MSLASRKKLVLAKIETVYGTDSIPTGSANAILLKGLSVNPIQAEQVSRDLIKPYFGNSEQLLAQKFVQMDFEVEFAGAGVAGKLPAYDSLLRACGFASALITAVVAAVVDDGVATLSKTAHGYSVGDKVTTTGFADSDLNGVQTITAVPTADTFEFATVAADAASAPGSLTAAVTYAPVSSDLESISMYYNVDGILHRMTGARGTVEISLAVKQIPTFKFSFQGLYNAPSDTAAPAVDYSAFQIPFIANTQNTPGFSLFGYTANMESMSLNMSNDVQYVPLIGTESVKLLDRKPAGTLVFEAPTIAAKDFFTLVSNNTQGAMVLSHGPKSGHKVKLECPSVLLGNPSYQESNGTEMLSVPFTASPVNGNDEILLTVY